MKLITPDSLNTRLSPPQTKALETLPKGSRIVVSLPSGLGLAEAALYAFKKGLVLIPVDPKISLERLSFIVSHSQCQLVIKANGEVDWKNIDTHLSDPEDRFILYTSGSTSEPKGVVLTKSAVEHNSLQVAKLHGFGPKAHATCLPLFHCNAMMMSLFGNLLAQGTVVIVSRFSPANYFRIIEENNVATASIVPALLQRIVAEKPQWPKSLQYLITAAAALPQSLSEEFYKLYGPRLVQGYGLTEAVNFSFVTPVLNDALFKKNYLENVPPVGLPLPGTQARIRDGEVQVCGPNLMKAYWRNPEATRAVFTEDGWLKTGDLGEWRGEYLVLKGRSKEIINRGGETLYPVEIEEELSKRGLPNPFAVVGVANDWLSDDIGLWQDGLSADEWFKIANNLRRHPGVVVKSPLIQTSTGKPKRLAMANGLFCVNEDPTRYQGIYDLARDIADRICTEVKGVDAHSSFGFIRKECEKLLAFPSFSSSGQATGPAATALKLLRDNRHALSRAEISGEELIQKVPGLWTSLMKDWPMGSYAAMAARFLIQNEKLSGKVLELGAGVGNTSELVKGHCGNEYLRTDLHESLLRRVQSPGTFATYNFNYPCPWNDFETIFAVNAIHCASDKKKTVAYLRDALKTDGILLLAEGAPVTDIAGRPWALNALFGLFGGWWDIGGFLPRSEWLSIMESAGFKKWGYSVLRAGESDLGGLIWAIK